MLEVKHKEIGDVVELPKEEFDRLEDTIEFLENKALQEGILQSLKEYARHLNTI